MVCRVNAHGLHIAFATNLLCLALALGQQGLALLLGLHPRRCGRTGRFGLELRRRLQQGGVHARLLCLGFGLSDVHSREAHVQHLQSPRLFCGLGNGVQTFFQLLWQHLILLLLQLLPCQPLAYRLHDRSCAEMQHLLPFLHRTANLPRVMFGLGDAPLYMPCKRHLAIIRQHNRLLPGISCGQQRAPIQRAHLLQRPRPFELQAGLLNQTW